nr:hypothetical protein [Tanacetum cinerariifolium]
IDQAEKGPNYALMAFSSSSSDSEIVDNCKKGLGHENYNAVPPNIRNFMPPTPDLSFIGLAEFVNKPVVKNCKAKSSKEEPKKLIFLPNVHGNPQIELQDQGVIDIGRSRHMIENMSYRTDYKEIDGGYVAFGGNPKGGKITRKDTKHETSGILKSFITRIENIDNKVKVIRCDNETDFKNREMNQFYEMKGILRKFSVARTPQQIRVAERRNRILIEAVRTMLVDSNKAFRVFNSRTRIVEENLHSKFSESTPNVVGSGPDWLFDIDALTKTINYEPIVAGTQSNGFCSIDGKKVDEDPRKESECKDPENEDNVNNTNNVDTANNVNTICSTVNTADTNRLNAVDDGAADMNNLNTTIQVSPIPTIRIHKDHPLDQVIGDLQSTTQIRKMTKNLEEHGFVSTIQQRTKHKDLQNCLFACILSQEEPKKIIHDETSAILKTFITGIEILIDHKVKVIRYDNETKFKNMEMNHFCEMKGIMRQYSVARTPQQNRVAERRNKTLIEAGKLDGKADEGFFVGYSLNSKPFRVFNKRIRIVEENMHISKAFRVFNSRTKIVEKNLHIRFSEGTPNVVGSGPDWLFDIDALTRIINYEPIVTGTVEDKILVPKPPKNCAWCTRCGYLVDGPHCQGCALLRQELEENLVTYSLDFQNTSEPSNASTSVVNATREPYVVKQDNRSFVDEIIFDLNRAPDSPNQFHCKNGKRGEAGKC